MYFSVYASARAGVFDCVCLCLYFVCVHVSLIPSCPSVPVGEY